MMTYQQLGDILKLIRRYHQRVRNTLNEAQESTSSEVVESIVSQLKQHENNWQIALSEYGDEGDDGVLNVWIQYVPNDDIQQAVQDAELKPDMSIDDIRQSVIQFHSALTALYRTMKDSVTAPRVSEFLTRLYEMEETVTGQQAWSSRST